ncbi:hypothetical protein [Streptomyces sp. MspMP-M5]|uniref:hypothetical protein n=1 Tax=unclassified Streptomyces TaxID=2593676 RepID=UPI00035ED805|nr:hypothetical protein [Streptomyces sp. MspMP-M5]MYT30857.1 hypothetical protein [Streptomyces sp. SID8354]
MYDNRALWPAAIALTALGTALFAFAMQLHLAYEETYVEGLSYFAGTAWGLALIVGAYAWGGRRLSSS